MLGDVAASVRVRIPRPPYVFAFLYYFCKSVLINIVRLYRYRHVSSKQVVDSAAMDVSSGISHSGEIHVVSHSSM